MLGIEPAREPLDRNTYNKHVDRLLETGQLNPEILEFCDSKQIFALNEIKKALVRITNKDENNKH